MAKKRKGLALLVVLIIILILILLGFAVLTQSEHESILGRIESDKNKAFYLAEAGLAKMAEQLQLPIVGNLSEVLTGTLESGSYSVSIDTNTYPCYVTATGISGTIQKTVRAQAIFLAPFYEDAIWSMNKSGTAYYFQLRGTGNPIPTGTGNKEGKDIINGNLFISGDAYLYDQGTIGPAPLPNSWNLAGDLDATGIISVAATASVAGSQNPNADPPPEFSLMDMDYENNNTHNVSQIFTDAGVSSGHLPAGNELRDVFVKNPGDRNAECASTSGDDYFFEPSSGFIEGSWNTAPTPLHAGNDRIYYIDGDLWVHSKNDTFGFNMDGKVTIVVTGNIHLSDNLQYADTSSMLGLVALGKYNGTGDLISGGNIYFGDPTYGTLYMFSGMMFAANNFSYNMTTTFAWTAEPKSGFMVNGSFAAVNQINIVRDWYTSGFTKKPAVYNPSTGQWVDAQTGTVLTPMQIAQMRHYQMIVNYDERVRNAESRPPGLPKGGIKIFAGYSNWEEL
jgi:Tfp pilus assembly protein PilX